MMIFQLNYSVENFVNLVPNLTEVGQRMVSNQNKEKQISRFEAMKQLR